MEKYGKIYLYGESHAKNDIKDEELLQWKKYYDEQGMRHLFIESPYYSGQILNRWMKADNDDLLMVLFENLRGTMAYHHSTLDFYRFIKKNCPETIFHATDVGHQYKTTGKWYLELLKSEGKEDTEEYRLTEENIEQGRVHKEENTGSINPSRESSMWKNFIREYESIGCKPIMGIYGSFHTEPGGTIPNGDPRMGTAITNRYGDAVEIFNLSVKFNYRGREYGKIHLCGEEHAVQEIKDEELRMWQKYYHEDGMRDLFVEMPYFTTQLLNRWMRSDSDEYYDLVFENLKTTFGGREPSRNFYIQLKKTCPETVIHGTDVGHQFATTGAYYLDLLEKEGKKDSEEYALTLESIEQGKRYRKEPEKDHAFREAAMGLNFVRAYEAIGCKPVMGIYGGYHTMLGACLDNGEPRMATAIRKRFRNAVEVTDLAAKFGRRNAYGKIHLYGESHAKDDIIAEELKIWKKYYDEEGMRHLFIERSYFEGKLLNRWMKSDNDDMLMMIFEACRGTLAYHHSTLDFYRFVKKYCPETVYHATDVGHQIPLGEAYLDMLRSEGKEDTEEYRLTEENIEQAKAHKATKSGAINYSRESSMWKNFIREYEAIGHPPIMGIYGSYHTKPGGTIPTGEPRMCTAISYRYGDAVEITNLTEQFNYRDREYGKIHLVGEYHAVPEIMEEELRMWQKYYHEDGMRDLFVEMPYYTAQILNRCMKSEDEALISLLLDNMKTASGSDASVHFYREIKRTCPETVLHGTDVGHQFETIGKYYLELLEKEGRKDTKEYDLTLEAIDQGRRYNKETGKDHAFREAAMGLNFVRAYEAIDCKPIMGIYGCFHTVIDGVLDNGEPRMAKALHKRFSKSIEITDLAEKFGYTKSEAGKK